MIKLYVDKSQTLFFYLSLNWYKFVLKHFSKLIFLLKCESCTMCTPFKGVEVVHYSRKKPMCLFQLKMNTIQILEYFILEPQ